MPAYNPPAQVLFSPVTNYYQGKAIRQQQEMAQKEIDTYDQKLALDERRVAAQEDAVATREEANAQAREAMEYKIGQERTAKTAYDLYVMTEKHNRRFAAAGKTEEAMAETLKNVVPDIQAYADSLPEELAEEKAKINAYLEDGIVTPEEWRGMSESAAEQARYYHPDLFAEGKPTVIADGAMALMPDGTIVENPKDFKDSSTDIQASPIGVTTVREDKIIQPVTDRIVKENKGDYGFSDEQKKKIDLWLGDTAERIQRLQAASGKSVGFAAAVEEAGKEAEKFIAPPEDPGLFSNDTQTFNPPEQNIGDIFVGSDGVTYLVTGYNERGNPRGVPIGE